MGYPIVADCSHSRTYEIRWSEREPPPRSLAPLKHRIERAWDKLEALQNTRRQWRRETNHSTEYTANNQLAHVFPELVEFLPIRLDGVVHRD